MKKIIALLIIITIFFTACQPTPPKPIVQNKNDDDLKEAMAQTATPIQSVTAENVDATSTPPPDGPIAYVEDISSNASNTVTVDIHAEVINNQPDNVPVGRIAPKEFTEDEVKQMVQSFFGNMQLYSREYTKEDYDSWILSKQLELNDEDKLKKYASDRNIADLGKARNQLQEVIERLKRERQDAPDIRDEADYSDLYSEHGLNLLADTGKGFLGNVKVGKNSVLLTAFNDDNNYYMSRDLYPDEHIDPGHTDEEFLKAKEISIQLIEDMQIDNVLLCDAYMAKDMSHTTDGGSYWNGREYYVFCFNTKVGDSVIDSNKTWVSPPALVDMSGKDGYEDVPEIVYDEIIPYESLEVWVEKDKIVQFKQRYPVKVTEIVNQNVAIAIDYQEAIENAKQFAYTAFIDPIGNSLEYKLNIDRIELVLIRIREKDTDSYIVVPAWSFCGSSSRKVNPENKNSFARADENGWLTDEGVESFSDVLITINALDGSVIDLYHGY